jgi:ADP-heptose:LPS heptosyltransferase
MNILIINFRRFGDIFSCGHLVRSYRESMPGATISMLVYKEFAAAARILEGIEKVYTVDRKRVVSLKCNPIFSDGHAINSFIDDLSDLRSIKWDQVVNYSSDEVSTLLSTFFANGPQKASIRGISLSNTMSTLPSCDWSLLFNDVMTGSEHPVMHFSDCYHHICDLPNGSDNNRLKVDHAYQQQVEKNLHALRKRESSRDLPIKIIGIHLKSADSRKNLPLETTIGLIGEILDDPTLYPIMLVAPTHEERQLADQINNSFDNKLVAIESSFSALVSVLNEIDLLVTPDTAPKHMADLTNTPVVEIATGPAPMRKQGSYQAGNLVVTTKLDCAPCMVKDKCSHEVKNKCCKIIQPSDIMAAINGVLTPDIPMIDTLSEGVTIYRTKHDGLGITYHPEAGAFNKMRELSIMMSRQVILSLFSSKDMDYQNIASTIQDNMLIKSWIRDEKANITYLSKSLLNTLRFVLYAQKNKRHVTDLATATEALVAFAQKPGLVGIIGKILRGKIEIFSGQAVETNIMEMETLLYSTKNDIQMVIRCLQGLDHCLDQDTTPGLTRHSTSNRGEVL